jgi:hypothetical protein
MATIPDNERIKPKKNNTQSKHQMRNLLKKLTAPLPRTKSSSLIAAVLALAPLHPAAAQTIYSTGFEAPELVAGLPLVGQDGWFPGPPFLSPDAAVITTC